MTKKQKEEQRAAELRRQALLASGVQIEGLQEKSGGATKRPIYGKKKGPSVLRGTSPAPTATDSTPQTPELPPSKELAPEPEQNVELSQEKAESAKSDWDASSDEESAKKPASEVKDSWDASSDEEESQPKPSKSMCHVIHIS